MSGSTCESRPYGSCAVLRVSLVDSDPSVHRAVRKILDGHTPRWELDIHSSPQSASEIWLSATPPDVVLVDIQMPGLSGLEWTARLRAVMPRVPLVICTACSERNTIFQFVMAGACGYLIKPVTPERLVAAASKAAQGWPDLCREAELAVVSGLHDACASGLFGSLSRRERELLPLLAGGLTDKEIANCLCVETSTVNALLKRLFRKLNVHSRNEALQKALNLRQLMSQAMD